MRRLMLVTTVATLAAGTAIADQYWVHDLGPTATHEECMARARKVFDAYVGANGGLGVDAASWTVYAWDMASRGQDGVIICLEGADGIVPARNRQFL